MTKPTAQSEIILVTVRGPDGPGITARLTGILAEAHGVRLLDIEQTVVHQKLLLSILLAFEKKGTDQTSVMKDLLFAAKKLGVALEFEVFDARWLGDGDREHQYAVTCLGSEVGAFPLSRIAQALATRGVNIDKISKLTRQSLSCVELLVHAARPLDPKRLTQELLGLSKDLEVDIAIQSADLQRRAKRLIALDMDSTLIVNEVIDELGRAAGVERRMTMITASALQGRRDFAQALTERVRLLKGLSTRALERIYQGIRLTQGAERLIRVLKHLGYRTALISGGFTYFTDKLRQRLGFDYAFANVLEIAGEKLTGRITGDLVDGRRKALILETIAQGEGIALDQTVALGDGANDLPMLAKAGLGIAFHAHDHIRRQAAHGLSKGRGLDSILYLLGISERELARLRL